MLLAKLSRELAVTATAVAHPNRDSDAGFKETALQRLRVLMLSLQRVSEAMLGCNLAQAIAPNFVPCIYQDAERIDCGPEVAAAIARVERFVVRQQRCPCCGYLTLGFRGADEICPVCFWEDDDPSDEFGQPARERPEGPNWVQLSEARQNFAAFGAAEERFRNSVRSPLADEQPENND